MCGEDTASSPDSQDASHPILEGRARQCLGRTDYDFREGPAWSAMWRIVDVPAYDCCSHARDDGQCKGLMGVMSAMAAMASVGDAARTERGSESGRLVNSRSSMGEGGDVQPLSRSHRVKPGSLSLRGGNKWSSRARPSSSPAKLSRLESSWCLAHTHRMATATGDG